MSGLLDILNRILQEILQQTFSTPSEYLTQLAYHACYYMSQLQHTNAANAPPSGTGPGSHQEPTEMVFCITNAFVEAEATLANLLQHHRELPARHITRELRRADTLLRDGRAVFKSWSRNPLAPGALPGTAGSQNALDGVSFAPSGP